ncbi:hypothetical protein F0562_015707 [Nyssa sinensis]|uniref:Uncharacterized protein n=1 Tax=Nyssa sinensis TaxID=561372 RepID=A0A5J4ZHQ0_9ASTE|nr:hypothetical protein F0562_015707 [Nyssa sinensis]
MATYLDFQFYFFLFFVWFVSTLLVRSIANQRSKSKTTIHHPPSPPALPVIGHLHLLGSVLSKSFQTLAYRYGPIMRLRIGPSNSSIVVSNATIAKEMLRNHELSFVSRPDFGASDFDIYKGSKFVNAEYGIYWRFMKKICMTELLAGAQLNRFVDIRKQEMIKFLEILAKCSEEGEACDIGADLMTMTNNVICRMAMSTRCSSNADESKEIRELVKEILDIAPNFSLGEMLGPLNKFDLFGYGRKLKTMLLQFDRLVEGIMVEHEKKKTDGEKERKDMMDILLKIYGDETAEVKLTRKDIKSFLMEIFMAGTETVSVSLKWTLAEVINHPEVFKKLREEINTVVGPTRLVEESDIPNLPYLQATVKESLRLHAPAPLVFRKCREDCKISGYNILANDRIIFNLYAIMRDPDSWEDPTAFKPERFLVSSMDNHVHQQQVDIKGSQNVFNYMPFGSGRRGCPGASLASTVTQAGIAMAVQCFDFQVKGADKVDMEEGSGLSSGMAHPLVCYPITHINPLEFTTSSATVYHEV